ncbi:hypothetical protein Glove_23g95 [Diversispora epigaea]|uniref:Protein kinase domain-containing protein n=1 Tax=Diversispora epigaea TaxID=1348612 RepID=A0A397JJ63_9GLOM|nr:hypothetical protein Glove_23g95 [Diversispora epigaea]
MKNNNIANAVSTGRRGERRNRGGRGSRDIRDSSASRNKTFYELQDDLVIAELCNKATTDELDNKLKIYFIEGSLEIDDSYLSEVPPKGKEDDKTYQNPQKIESIRLNRISRIKNLFIEISVDPNIYQDDITATENKIKEYRELLDKTALRLNRIRMARAQLIVNKHNNVPYATNHMYFLNGAIHQWGIGNPEFDKIIRDSKLSIKYPNGFIQWIPYEKLTNVEFIGRGAYANVYKTNWVERLGTWDYALGKRVQYPNTSVTAYIKSSSSTVLRCYVYLHIRRLVHRDLHSGNLLHYRRTISVSDLGLCRSVDDVTPSNEIFSVLLFIDPEVLKGEPYTQASDVYSNLNEFNKSPLPDTLQQFITNESKSSDEAHYSNVEYASQSIKTQTIRDPNLEKRAAKIKKKVTNSDTNSDDDGNKYEDEANEWNTIYVNDYQNWLYELDIMRDFSGGKIASIVINKIPQLNYEPPTPPPTPLTGKNKTTNESTLGIQVTDPLEAYTNEFSG